MTRQYNISDKSVKKATGKSWKEWFALLNKKGAAGLAHKEIVQLLRDNGLDKEWWAQSVTVGYEYDQGLRVKGETADAGFQIGVQKTMAVEAGRLWNFLTSDRGISLWLGQGIQSLTLAKGQPYQTKEGTAGEIRSIHPGKKIRLTWQPAGWDRSSILQLSLLGKNNKTALHFHQEKLSGARQRGQMQAHWQSVIRQIIKELPAWSNT